MKSSTDISNPMPWLAALRRQGWVVGLCAVVAAVVAVGGTALAPPNYQTASVVRVAPVLPPGDAFSDIDPRGFQEVERYYRTQAQLLQSRDFLARARNGSESGVYAGAVRVEAVPLARSQLVRISVQAADPDGAAKIANLMAERFVAEHIGGGADLSPSDAEMRGQITALQEEFSLAPGVDATAGDQQLVRQLQGAMAQAQAAAVLADKPPPDASAQDAVKTALESAIIRIRTTSAAAANVSALQAQLDERARRRATAVTIDRAPVPTASSGPQLWLVGAAGAVLGALLALALLAARTSMLPARTVGGPNDGDVREAAK